MSLLGSLLGVDSASTPAPAPNQSSTTAGQSTAGNSRASTGTVGSEATSMATPAVSVNLANGSSSTSDNTPMSRADIITLGSTPQAGNVTYQNVANTNKASAAAAQNNNAASQQTSTANLASANATSQQASNTDADYSQAIRSLSALNKMTLAYNKAIEASGNATMQSQAVRGRAKQDFSPASQDTSQLATDLSRSGAMTSLLLSSQTLGNAQSANMGGSSGVKAVAKV